MTVTITQATPITFGALTGICSERTGVVNIGIEGMLLTAAFYGFMVGVYTHNPFMALGAAIVSSALMALLHALLSITFRVDQIISGTVINILAVGMTGYLNRQLFTTGAPPGLSAFPRLNVPGLSDLPWIGPILFQQKPLALTAIVLVFVVHFTLFRTQVGTADAGGGRAPAGGGHGWRGRQSAALRERGDWRRDRRPGWRVLHTGVGAPLRAADDQRLGFIGLAAMIVGKWTPFGALGRGAAVRRGRGHPRGDADPGHQRAVPADLAAALRADDRGRRRRRWASNPAGGRWPAVCSPMTRHRQESSPRSLTWPSVNRFGRDGP